jgi:hypothetical protein
MTRARVAWVAASIALALLAFFAGRALHGQDTQAASFDLSGPAFETSDAAVGLSKAGFSGFTEAGDGRTVISGRIVSTTSDAITVESPSGQRSTLRLTGQAPLSRLEPSTRAALRPGVTVIVRRDGGIGRAALVVAEP